MNTITKEIDNKNGTTDMVVAKSSDNCDVLIGSNYKLIKFSGTKKSFKDTIFGSDIGIHSNGFVNVAIISLLIATMAITLMYLKFRV